MATHGDAAILVLDPDPARGARVARILSDGAATGTAATATSPQEVDADTVAVALVSLDAPDPLAWARKLASEHDSQAVFFYGEVDGLDAWVRRISYEPLLPAERGVLRLDDPQQLRETVASAMGAETARQRLEPTLERVNRDVAAVRRSVEATLVDALAQDGTLRDAYTAVVRGALAAAEGGDTDPEVPEHLARAVQSALRRVEVLRGPEARADAAQRLRDALGDRATTSRLREERRRWGQLEAEGHTREWLVRVCETAGLHPDDTAAVVAALELIGETWRGAWESELRARYVPGAHRIAFTWQDPTNGELRLTMRSSGDRAGTPG